MGLLISKALADSSAPPLPNFSNIGQAAAAAIKAEKPSYLELPAPVKYEETQREAMMTLKPDLFEGMRFEFNKPLNQNFFLTHSIFMGNMDLSTGGRQALKTPMGSYDFGANVITEKYMLLGRISTDGRLTGRAKYEFSNWLSTKLQMQLTGDPGQSQIMWDMDAKGGDWNAQLKLGNPPFLGVNYFQSVTPQLSAGGEFFCLPSNLKSGVGLSMRHQGSKHAATLQVATTGVWSMQYAHKVNDKISLAADFLWHWNARDVTATVGYEALLRHCRLRGKIDTQGVVSAYLEERLTPGVNFLLSAELDHPHSNYKFGFGIMAGE